METENVLKYESASKLGDIGRLPVVKKDKWTICSHGDGDGVCSAAIALSVPRFKNADLVITHPMGINHDIRDIETNLFISDIALDARTYMLLYAKFESLLGLGYQVIYIDHHRLLGTPPDGMEMINDESACASELVHKYFTRRNELPEMCDLLACVGCVCDYMDETDYITDVMNKFEKRSLFLDAGIMAQGLSVYRKKETKEHFVRQLVSGLIPCEIPELVYRALEVSKSDKDARRAVIENTCCSEYIAWSLNPPCGKSKAAHFSCSTKEKMVGLAIFYYKRRKEKEVPLYDLCFRGTSTVDLREIITPLALFLGGSGGGHANAVGSRVPVSKLPLMLYYIDVRMKAYFKSKTYTNLPLPNNDANEKFDEKIYNNFIDLKSWFKVEE
ncbi:hypothetical protein EIN_424520 [Entamoeba invadens IP1]|uniref:DDH domain-containing protein n=2 Tax=Entamoeba invadens TaxID=33085 RepID=A0A0A1U609_ENTIV|nr:hypothetical protein EIN_424520 [Entamoeba invadens IP1]ELP89760.1 hypothetical protein EIN_424520 [Entamoeba invadens IP1]BAN42012.1 hypothetical protein, conserved [Entamoeba invadens]|eukprot:XP_004256531.1 hypothetical protein EIN_424520 [Entamoeba invadens IP1]